VPGQSTTRGVDSVATLTRGAKSWKRSLCMET